PRLDLSDLGFVVAHIGSPVRRRRSRAACHASRPPGRGGRPRIDSLRAMSAQPAAPVTGPSAVAAYRFTAAPPAHASSGERSPAAWMRMPIPSPGLQRDVAVLAGRPGLALRAQHPERADELRARLRRLDHVVDVAELGGDVRVREPRLVLVDELAPA